MRLDIAVLPGDGIGPEVTEEAVRVLRAVASIHQYQFAFQEHPVGGTAIRQFGTPLPAATLEACLSSDAVLLGAVGGPDFDDLPRSQRPEAGLLMLRQALGGFANLRPVICHDAIVDCSPLRAEVVRGADLLVVRELLGGIYFGDPRGFSPTHDEAFNTMRYSAEEIARIARIAFDLSRSRRRKVTSVDKANVLETSQLWRKKVSEVHGDYPDVQLEHLYVDSCAMRLVTSPAKFDVLLTENLFGDILSDEAAGITGSLGMQASATIGGTVNLYEPVHGSAPDIAGGAVANPLGAIASAALLLRHSADCAQDADDIEEAIAEVLSAGYRTPDIARPQQHSVTTRQMGTAVEQALGEVIDRRRAYHAV